MKPRKHCGDWFQSRVAENSGDRPIRLHPSPAGIGGRDSRCEKVRASRCGKGRPESVLSGTQAIKNTSTGLAGGCHLTGIALCSSLTRPTRKYDVTCLGITPSLFLFFSPYRFYRKFPIVNPAHFLLYYTLSFIPVTKNPCCSRLCSWQTAQLLLQGFLLTAIGFLEPRV